MRILSGLKSLLMSMIAVLIFTACAPGKIVLTPTTPTPSTTSPIDIQKHNQKLVRANEVLTQVGTLAERTFYACMLDAYLQGLSTNEMSEQCATKLIEDNDKGFGDLGPPFSDVKHKEMFDPTKIKGVCNSGNSGVGQTSGYAKVPGQGYYSWGGDANHFYQYDQKQSETKKKEAIEKAEKLTKEFDKLEKAAEGAKAKLDEAKKGEDKEKIKALEEAWKLARQDAINKAREAVDARKDARKDPNEKPLSTSHPASFSPCEQALSDAREFLRECHRTNWKIYECQQLLAETQGCPDPALILVDPEQGYTCGSKPSAAMLAALKDAWVARCETLKRPVPGGPNPCQPPQFDESDRKGKGTVPDVCNDPYAYIEPASAECVATFQVKPPFGEPNLRDIAVWGLNNLGGPIIVLQGGGTDTPRPGQQPTP